MIPGEIRTQEGEIAINAGRATITLEVKGVSNANGQRAGGSALVL